MSEVIIGSSGLFDRPLDSLTYEQGLLTCLFAIALFSFILYLISKR